MPSKVSKAEFVEELKVEIAFEEAELAHQAEFINRLHQKYELNKKSGFVVDVYTDLITHWESNRKALKNTINEIKETIKKLSF
jgi:hypothetical protein